MPTPEIFTSVINSYLPEPHASLLNGILFGTPVKTSKLLYQELKMVGLLHIVVLSGMNITIIAATIASLTASFGKRVSILITILMVIFFILFVGFQAPVIRAGIMGILTLVAILYGRKNLALYALLISALLNAIFWPKLFMTISFQLSYGATLGIIFFARYKKIKSDKLLGRITNWVWKELKPTLAAQVFTVPIIFIYFKQISIIAPLSNLLISFVIPPLMIFGFLAAILGKVNFFLGLLPAYISYILINYIVSVIHLLSKFPFAYFQF